MSKHSPPGKASANAGLATGRTEAGPSWGKEKTGKGTAKPPKPAAAPPGDRHSTVKSPPKATTAGQPTKSLNGRAKTKPTKSLNGRAAHQKPQRPGTTSTV